MIKRLLTGLVRYMSNEFDLQPPLRVNQLDSAGLNCPMNSRVTPIPTGNSSVRNEVTRGSEPSPS